MFPPYYRVTARVESQQECPLYRTGDALTFCEQIVEGAHGGPVCATAVRNLHPAIRSAMEAASAAPVSGVFCGGCTGRAHFSLASEPRPEPVVTAEFAQTLLGSLEHIPLFAGATRRQLESTLPCFHEFRCVVGEEVTVKGQSNQGFYILLEGSVDVWNVDEHGTENRLNILGRGESFGEMSLLTGEQASATVRARGDVVAAMIRRADFLDVLSRIPALTFNIAKLLAQRLAKTGNWLVEELHKGITGKLDQIAPGELVQALNINAQTGTLLVQNGSASLSMYFHQGQIVDIELGDVKGEEAFYAFLKWKRGRFRFDSHARTEPPSHVFDPMSLLLEGMRRMDDDTRA